MSSMRHRTIWAIVIIAVLGVTFVMGESIGQRQMLSGMNIQLDSMQAKLTFNRILDERHLGDLLAKGCVAQAGQMLMFLEDQDTRILSEFFRSELDPSVSIYISKRDPDIVRAMKSFKSKFGPRWREPTCEGGHAGPPQVQ